MKPGHLIRRNHQRAVALFAEELRDFDITPVQYQILTSLRENPGIDQATLSGLVAIDKSTIADVLARMEDRNLLVRDRGVVDQRTKVVFLSPAGQDMLASLEPLVEHVQERIVAPLSEVERVALETLLIKLIRAEDQGAQKAIAKEMPGRRPVRHATAS